MKYSLSCRVSNSSGVTKNLNEEEMSSLTNGDTSYGDLFLLSGEKASIICDLNSRYSLSSFKYYYSGDGEVSMSVAESLETWNTVPHSSIVGGIQSPLSGYSPRWLKVSHEVTTGSGNMYEVVVYNDDSAILFGPSGSFSSYSLDASGTQSDSVAIFNSTASIRDINVFVGEGVETEADNLMSVGITSSGIFYSKREYGLHLPRNFSWDSGRHINTIDSSGHLTLSGTSTSGTYYSPVFNADVYKNSRVFWD